MDDATRLVYLEVLGSPEPELASTGPEQQLALEQLVDQLPAAQATALRPPSQYS